VEFRVLGPISARRDGEELPLGGPKPRTLLAMLLLHANEPVSRDRLMDGLWGERPPAAAGHSLEDYVSRIRKVIGADRLQRYPPGYFLRVETGELDLDRFERLLEAGGAAVARGDTGEAAELLRSALAEWRGPALADVLDEPFAAAASQDLEERRLLAVEQRMEVELALGGARELIPELKTLVRQQPFRERPIAHLMLAQYRSGDAAAALDTFTQARRRLAEELGLEPGSSLRRLERQILEHDPSLAVESPSPRRETRRPRRRRSSVIAVATAGAVMVGAVATGLLLGARSHPDPSRQPAAGDQGLVALASDQGGLGKLIALGTNPAAIAAAAGSLWVADPNRGEILRVDPAAGTVVDRIPVSGAPGALTVGGGSIWVATTQPGGVKRIDVATDTVTETIPLGINPSAIAYGAGSVWVADPSDESLIELDPVTDTVRETVTLATRPSSLTVGVGAVWIASHDEGIVTEVDPQADAPVATIAVGQGPSALAVGAGSVWVANELGGTVSRIDPQSAIVVATLATGSGPEAIAFARGSIWVANEFSRTVSQIDPASDRVSTTVRSGGAPMALASMAGTVWAGTRSVAEHRGGTLVLLAHGQFTSMDPALEYEVFPPQLHGLAYDALVAFEHTGGPQGLRLVPDLALALPTPGDAGRTYAFRLRPGIRYADGRQLQASDIRRAFERLYRLSSPITTFFDGIVGATRCGPASCHLKAGVVVDDRLRTVVFHLTGPDPEFLFKLAFVFTAPVPPGTPLHELRTKPFPGTGPYRIARATPHEVVLVRNRYFHEWSYAAQPQGNPDSIVWRFGGSPGAETRTIESGRADWMFDAVPSARLHEVAAKFAGELHLNAAPETAFLMINTRLRPFDDVRVRQALNLAIDRRRIASLYGRYTGATPTCQVLPPGLPGYERYCPYTLHPGPAGRWTAPDPSRARRLVSAAGARGARVELWGFHDDAAIPPTVIRYMASVLRRLGLRVHLAWTTHAGYHRLPPNVQRRIQLLPNAWYADFPAPSDFFDLYIACSGANNWGHFCDSTLDRTMRRAAGLEVTDPRRASALWARVDRRTVDEAAWVPLVNPQSLDFVSPRVQNYQHNPMWGFLADQVWLR
jgi:peptide/nickel transport system substrate-binding protein